MTRNFCNFKVRAATPADIPAMLTLLRNLATHEGDPPEAVVGTAADLQRHLFGDRPKATVMLAEVQPPVLSPNRPRADAAEPQSPDRAAFVTDPFVVGIALYFYTFSSFLAQPSLYLEDLFVQPDYRGQGIGKALLQTVAQAAIAAGCDRLDWLVSNQNTAGIQFYEYLGATVRSQLSPCRLEGSALHTLAKLNLDKGLDC